MKNKLKLWNSSSKQLATISKEKITIYLCGPTVYNHVHIGNLRPIITFDVLHRYLLAKGHQVDFVQNITDIDDRIVKKAIKAKKSEKEIADHYLKAYEKILADLNILPMVMPRVSENIDAMIEYIEKLIEKNHAYYLNEDVYFSLLGLKDYGVVSNMGVEELNLGERIAIELGKNTPNDFVLWKHNKEGINWDSKMGKGRPGWHTECCVLINKFLGEQVDIHGGGIDLRFPHHENENIQNIAMYNKELAKVWCHVGHLTIWNQKMSKSLNNFILAKDVLKQADGNAIRWMFYQTKYERPLNYFDEILIESKKAVEKIERELNRAFSYLLLNDHYLEFKTIDPTVFEILDHNLDLPNLVTFIYDQIKMFSKNISQKNFKELNQNFNCVKNTLKLIGIDFENLFTEKNIKLLKEWDHALKSNDYKTADQLRIELIEMKLL
ncbi:MAG: cysteine--tRNA ligase [Mycoplasmoidaceae bacterium]